MAPIFTGFRFGFGGGTDQVVSFSASGGTESTVGGYRYHVFTGPGTFTVVTGVSPEVAIDYVVCAAGGNGSGAATNNSGGGGGGGGLRYGSYNIESGNYPITAGGGDNIVKYSNDDVLIYANRGGNGAYPNNSGSPGGSGGGGGNPAPGGASVASPDGISPTSQGNGGGPGSGGRGGGGGGAGGGGGGGGPGGGGGGGARLVVPEFTAIASNGFAGGGGGGGVNPSGASGSPGGGDYGVGGKGGGSNYGTIVNNQTNGTNGLVAFRYPLSYIN